MPVGDGDKPAETLNLKSSSNLNITVILTEIVMDVIAVLQK